ncbi:hypothetical protein EDC01DRAFT_778395 [Geopyxis carbonaria]|nr:hypothetical protein EDC01DRAFT_778395 [Geopyxis carbonaria]
MQLVSPVSPTYQHADPNLDCSDTTHKTPTPRSDPSPPHPRPSMDKHPPLRRTTTRLSPRPLIEFGPTTGQRYPRFSRSIAPSFDEEDDTESGDEEDEYEFTPQTPKVHGLWCRVVMYWRACLEGRQRRRSAEKAMRRSMRAQRERMEAARAESREVGKRESEEGGEVLVPTWWEEERAAEWVEERELEDLGVYYGKTPDDRSKGEENDEDSDRDEKR